MMTLDEKPVNPGDEPIYNFHSNEPSIKVSLGFNESLSLGMQRYESLLTERLLFDRVQATVVRTSSSVRCVMQVTNALLTAAKSPRFKSFGVTRISVQRKMTDRLTDDDDG